ncbi:hypothetical protein DPMN_070452 [Dreissena polymorpha]|uniref:GDP-mannose 4,6-dehydratase n=2 Tax=Dreissena polymorpha TaxID=45954 RepID=A0A9D3Z673_DREPO|nr:hypothetical protein DPMN_070452 [Dreissena polymorpha]
MWLMLQHVKPEDFVISTNEVHSVRQFVVAAFKKVDIDVVWEGEGVSEVGKNKATGEVLVKVNPKYYRPTEVEFLQGDCSKAKEKLGWKPKYDFDTLVGEMVESDINLMKSRPMA